ncbi:ABC transporter permease [Metallibacterium sp.]|uniref:ABC transporter permease n=1 Tax=Metallibacterium sp. TaxID=2940281 RepID=UPI0026174319|nr:ABC transporter permease [Metallibacterium sp.]
MRQRAWWGQLGAYALLALAIAATTLAFAVLQAWDSPLISGAAPGYRYLALGYQRARGDDFASLATNQLPAIQPKLPADWLLGTGFSSDVSLAPQLGKSLPSVKVGLVFGDYLQSLHLHPLAGRLISLRDQQDGNAVILLSAGQAQRWFGSAQAAVGRVVYDSRGLALRVIGVLPAAFKGTERLFFRRPTVAWIPGTLVVLVSSGNWPTSDGKKPAGNLLARIPVTGPAPLLSVPDDVGAPRLRAELARAFAQSRAQLPKDVRGFAVATPYSLAPVTQRQYAQRMRLFLGLALAALVLAAINVLVLQWLGHLRRRGILNLERILGARRSFLMRRMLMRDLLALFVLLLGSTLLAVLGAVILRHVVSNLAAVVTVDALLAPLARVLPAVVVAVMLAELLPMLLLLGRERLDGVRTVTGAHGDRVFGVVLLAAEITLGVVMSVLAVWAIAYAWHATHEKIGFLDRSATLVEVQPQGDVFGALTHPDQHKAQVFLQQTLQVLASVQPGAVVGAGPQIMRNTDYDLPKSISADKRTAGACVVSATPGWITAAGVRLLAGVNFDTHHAQADLVLLDARLAARLFGSARDALGRSINEQGAPKPWRVIGVVAPVYLHGTRQDHCPVLFKDLRNSVFGLTGDTHMLVLSGHQDSAQRQTLHERLDTFFQREHAGFKVKSIRSTTQTRDWLAAQQILQSRVFTAIALVAWAIALSGIVALLRLYLAQRRRLLAIESALGATPSRTYRGVVLGTLGVAGIGAIIALLLLPWLATQYALLSGAQVAPFGWATWIALAVLLLAVFLVAHFPARRAARAEPAQSLHEL